VIVVWEHVTPSDKKISLPPATVQFKISDPRAVQFWDDTRSLSRLMIHELPRDTLESVAEVDSDRTAIAWDCVALYRAGRLWNERFPVPDWAGRPVREVTDTMMVRLRALERTPDTVR
jgi:hypothetical protein